jgi:hypothetical protein
MHGKRNIRNYCHDSHKEVDLYGTLVKLEMQEDCNISGVFTSRVQHFNNVMLGWYRWNKRKN